ncbi:MAG: DUF1846 domain-containing protein [Ruminococcaceae bacterium]|nr:DUF1846 domain-containing protein [Oscillospiraceae bacterium]
MKKIGFDGDKYIRTQMEKITERIDLFGGKLYLEFGGKLFDDQHAASVLPGYRPNGKIEVLQAFKDMAEMILCISAKDIESNKMNSNLGITYEMDVLRHMDKLRALGLHISSVVITLFTGQEAAIKFKNMLEQRGESVYIHTPTLGYPTDVNTIVSDAGYGANPYIQTSRPLVVVTAPGPGSGKLATCLSQLYHEYKRGSRAGYAKFETFPIWNLPLKHPVNLAYEAATADLKDVNMIDPFHLEAYGVSTTNYNRDVEVFPVVRTILSKIMGDSVYRSPTDMGVNMVGFCISDNDVVNEASRQEIIRRYYRALTDAKVGKKGPEEAERILLIMNEMGISTADRRVVAPALKKAASIEPNGTDGQVVSLELPDGTIVTGKSLPIMNATASVIINAVKYLAGIADDLHLISPVILEPMMNMKKNILHNSYPVLNAEEVLSAMSICAATNPTVAYAVTKLPILSGCDAHSSSMISSPDASTYKKLGIKITCEPEYPTKKLYFK